MTMKGIIICYHPDNKEYLDRLLESIKTDYPITVLTNGIDRPENSYELGAIHIAKKIYDEFILLQDSVLIKDNTLFDVLFNIDGNVFITEGGYHYMGKFVSNTLGNIPTANNKDDSIRYELHWLDKPFTIMDNPLPVHTEIFDENKGGRMRLESKYLIKWKGTWSK